MEVSIVVPIPPQVKRRPRFGGGPVFPDKKDQEYEKAVRDAIEAEYRGPQIEGNVRLEVYLGKYFMEIVVKEADGPRVLPGDTDNYVKAVCDCIQDQKESKSKPYRRGLVKNDARIVEILAVQVELEGEREQED